MQMGYAEIAILSQYLAPSRAVNAKCNTFSRNGPQRVDDSSRLVAGKWRCLLMTVVAGKWRCLLMTRSLNVARNTTEQHLIVRNGKSEA